MRCCPLTYFQDDVGSERVTFATIFTDDTGTDIQRPDVCLDHVLDTLTNRLPAVHKIPFIQKKKNVKTEQVFVAHMMSLLSQL